MAAESSGDVEEAPLLDVADLTTHFLTRRGRVRAVDGVSFRLHRGTVLGIVGESGSGKTVLTRSIMHLLPKENVVRTGQVRFEGQDLAQLGDKAIRAMSGRDVAMVFQDPMTSLNPVMTIGKQIGEPLRQHLGMGRRQAQSAAVDLLRSLQIPEPERRVDEYPHQLSGGMRQRVVIALALACGPQLLLADEPTTALDVTVQAEILNVLADQQAERHMAMVLVTHDLGVVAGRTDETAVMYAGRIVEHARTEVLFRSMRHPYTEALVASIPRIEQGSHQRLRVIQGRPPELIHPAPGCRFAPRCPYVHGRCTEEEPLLVDVDDTGHRLACHAPLGSPQATEALERNLAQGLPQAVAVAEAGGTAVGAPATASPGARR